MKRDKIIYIKGGFLKKKNYDSMIIKEKHCRMPHGIILMYKCNSFALTMFIIQPSICLYSFWR